MPLPDGFTVGLYFADDGNQYFVKMPYYYVLNGLHRVWDSYLWPNRPNLPPGLIMRHVNMVCDQDRTRRSFPVSRVEPGYWPFVGASVTLPRQNGTIGTYKVVSYTSEKFQPLRYQRQKR